MYRTLQVIETRQWCAAMLQQSHFNKSSFIFNEDGTSREVLTEDDGTKWAAQQAASYGLTFADVRIWTTEYDPRPADPSLWLHEEMPPA